MLAVLLPVLPIMYGSRQFLLRKHKERIASNAPWGMAVGWVVLGGVFVVVVVVVVVCCYRGGGVVVGCVW